MSRVLLPAVLTVALLAGGCGGDSSPRAGDGDRAPRSSAADPGGASASASAVAPGTGDPSAPADTSPADPGGSASATAGPGHKVAPPLARLARRDPSWSHLLAPAAMPRVDTGLPWRLRLAGPETTRPVGACQKTSLTDLGALHAVRQVLAGPSGAGVRARQVVGRFADRRSAWRAAEVLEAWRDDCEDRLDYPSSDVGPMRPVTVAAGTGAGYRASYGDADEPATAGLGIVRKGRWLVVVEVSTAPDADASGVRTPTRRAVRRVALTFG